MKKIAFLSFLCLVFAAAAFATTFPVFEPFYDATIQITWEQFWSLDATLESVQAASEAGVNNTDSPMGDGWIGKSSATATGYASAGHVTGDFTDADYTIQAYVWTPVVNTTDEPDDYWYQQLVFYQHTGYSPYGRLHTQFNEAVRTVIRCQVNGGTWVTTMWEDPTDFTATEGWHKLKAALNGTTADCYYDDALLGTHDWTADYPALNQGKFGFGQYIDGAGTRSVYFDNVKVWATGASEPADPVPPTPTPSPTPSGAQGWSLYE